ncbi:hypothetical protein AGOR_G00144410 [Albula goreensis]|uniref:Chloride channel CLIC-like protein 1 n=1 Tax=Albula goreensis TaxID=1534307 RepID=A0A8T3D5C1_9TELE|nr:hypothetical protein AGOR_G00144410 [Albula goreensis]
MSFWPFILLILGWSLADVRGQDDDWIDPFDMTRYDPTTKTMRSPIEEPEISDPEGDQDSESQSFLNNSDCYNKLSMLQREIKDIKQKASALKEQPGFISVPNSKMDQLLKSIQKLRTPHKDDFCHVSLLDTYLEEARKFISVAAGHLTDLTKFISQPDVSLVSSVCPVTLLCLSLSIAVKLCRGKKVRDGPEDNEANDLQNDDRMMNREADRNDLKPEGHSLDPPIEDLHPEQADEGILQNNRGRSRTLPQMSAVMKTTPLQSYP